MKKAIICDQDPDGWNYDTCIMCKHFSCTISPKGHRRRCKLNSKTAEEKRTFQMVVAIELLKGYGVDIPPDEIIIDYVGKKKKS